MEVNIRQAKADLSRLIERAEKGEDVTIMRANIPVARLTVARRTTAKRELGWARGKFTVPADFDDPLPPEIEAGFCR